MSTETCMIVGRDHDWQQYIGMIVEAEEFGLCEGDEGETAYMVYRTHPTFYHEGAEIVWQRRHLRPFDGQPEVDTSMKEIIRGLVKKVIALVGGVLTFTRSNKIERKRDERQDQTQSPQRVFEKEDA